MSKRSNPYSAGAQPPLPPGPAPPAPPAAAAAQAQAQQDHAAAWAAYYAQQAAAAGQATPAAAAAGATSAAAAGQTYYQAAAQPAAPNPYADYGYGARAQHAPQPTPTAPTPAYPYPAQPGAQPGAAPAYGQPGAPVAASPYAGYQYPGATPGYAASPQQAYPQPAAPASAPPAPVPQPGANYFQQPPAPPAGQYGAYGQPPQAPLPQAGYGGGGGGGYGEPPAKRGRFDQGTPPAPDFYPGGPPPGGFAGPGGSMRGRGGAARGFTPPRGRGGSFGPPRGGGRGGLAGGPDPSWSERDGYGGPPPPGARGGFGADRGGFGGPGDRDGGFMGDRGPGFGGPPDRGAGSFGPGPDRGPGFFGGPNGRDGPGFGGPGGYGPRVNGPPGGFNPRGGPAIPGGMRGSGGGSGGGGMAARSGGPRGGGSGGMRGGPPFPTTGPRNARGPLNDRASGSGGGGGRGGKARTGADGAGGRDQDKRRTLTDFRIVGLEVKEVGWAWEQVDVGAGVGKVAEKKGEEDGERGDGRETKKQKVETESPSSSVATLHPPPSETPAAETPAGDAAPSAEPSETPKSPKSPSPSKKPELTPTPAPAPALAPAPPKETSRLRIYFSSPASSTPGERRGLPKMRKWGVPASTPQGKEKEREQQRERADDEHSVAGSEMGRSSVAGEGSRTGWEGAGGAEDLDGEEMDGEPMGWTREGEDDGEEKHGEEHPTEQPAEPSEHAPPPPPPPADDSQPPPPPPSAEQPAQPPAEAEQHPPSTEEQHPPPAPMETEPHQQPEKPQQPQQLASDVKMEVTSPIKGEGAAAFEGEVKREEEQHVKRELEHEATPTLAPPPAMTYESQLGKRDQPDTTSTPGSSPVKGAHSLLMSSAASPASAEVPEPSANRISISYARNSRRIVIDAEVVEKMRIHRAQGWVEIVVRFEQATAEPQPDADETSDDTEEEREKERVKKEVRQRDEKDLWRVCRGILVEALDPATEQFVPIERAALEASWAGETSTPAPGRNGSAFADAEWENPLVPPLHRLIVPPSQQWEDAPRSGLPQLSVETVTFVCKLDTANPLTEPKWVRSGDVDEWIMQITGIPRGGFAARRQGGRTGWQGRIEVLDPDPAPTIQNILENWVINSPVGLPKERRKFVKSHLSQIDNLLEILLRLVRFERVGSGSDKQQAANAAQAAASTQLHNLHGPLAHAAASFPPDSPYAASQTHVSLAVLALFRLTGEFATVAGIAKETVDERVSEIVRALPQHLLFKSVEGVFREYLAARRLQRAER